MRKQLLDLNQLAASIVSEVTEEKSIIEKWNLVRENPKLQGAPVESDQRYAKNLWSKKC